MIDYVISTSKRTFRTVIPSRLAADFASERDPVRTAAAPPEESNLSSTAAAEVAAARADGGTAAVGASAGPSVP